MPTLETPDGKPVAVAEAEDIDRAFQAAMNDDGPDEQAPPKRQRRAEPDGETPAPKRRGRPPKSEQPRTITKPAAGLDDKTRGDGVKGLAQLGAGVCLMLGKVTKKDAYQADAITIAGMADDIAQACVDTAKADPGFAAALDRVCSIGPYGALITVGVGLAGQLVRNHRPGLLIPGTRHPADLIAAAEAQAQPVPVAAA